MSPFRFGLDQFTALMLLWQAMSHQGNTVTRNPFNLHGLTFILASISGYIDNGEYGEITYPFPNIDGTTIEVWEWMGNFVPNFTGHVITNGDPC